MKRFTYLVITLLFLGFAASAQNRGNRGQRDPDARKQVEAAHIAWMTNQLALTPDEATRFWPLWNSYQNELKPIVRKRREAKMLGAAASETDELEIESKVLEIRKRYQSEFRKVLPDKRAIGIFRADREFQDQLIKQLAKRRQQNPQ